MHPALPRLLSILAIWGTSTVTWAASRPPLAPIEGEVIVQFKAGAAVVRAHALSARASASAVRGVMDGRAAALGARTGLALEAGNPVGTDGQVVRASGMSTAALLARLNADPEVAYAVPNQRVRRSAAPNDPLYAALTAAEIAANARPNGPAVGQWYLRAPSAQPLQAGQSVSAINAEGAWGRTTGSASVVVAVLDTGVRTDHPDLAGRLLPGYDFVSNATVANDGSGRDGDPSDPGDWVTRAEALSSTFTGCTSSNSSWHGTATASLVGAAMNNSIGMAGVAPGVSILPVRVLGKCFGAQSDILDAMRWAAGIPVAGVPANTTPAKVLNMSLGGCKSDGNCGCDAAYQSAVDDVLATGAVIIAAAGNSNGGPVEAPGSCAGVITVSAIRHAGTKVGFSSVGPEVSIAAPGGNCVNVGQGVPCVFPLIAATNLGLTGPAAASWTDSIDFEVGTSFAAPLVAGTAGLMFSARPSLSVAQLRGQLLGTARAFPTTGGTAGVGACRAPAANLAQDECYCTTSTCGAGMLDAFAAVAAVSGPLARIDVTPPAPTVGSTVTLSAAGSSGGASSSIDRYAWTLVDNGGVVLAFSSATDASTATLTASAAGSFRVRLVVTNSLGETATTEQTVTVAATAVTPVTPPTTSGGGGGGGTSSPLWLALLALAVAALFRAGPRRA